MESTDNMSQTVDKTQVSPRHIASHQNHNAILLYFKVPPLLQKRMVAFINHFIISSCGFLNEFATKCESKFIELERKMQRIESALVILEAKLASTPVLEDSNVKTITEILPQETEESLKPAEVTEIGDTVVQTEEVDSVRASNDVRYRKYFKMLQFGVPVAAVKLKMQQEGVENIELIHTPNLILADGINYKEPEM